MQTADDIAQMKKDLAEVRGDNEVEITIRRGTTTLSAQKVRIAGGGNQAALLATEGAEESQKGVVVLGAIDLNIQVADRFNANGMLYAVDFVHPNRRSRTEAEAHVIQ